MSTPHRWDLLVLGGGTAGIVAAKTAAGFGARVLLVERDRTGIRPSGRRSSGR